jgi:D-serine deaminase-like pyridoxal phosphate-dependent protein
MTMALDPHHPLLSRVPTPALVVDVAALDRNIAHMARRATAAGTALRPHIKTHKSADIARRQVAAGAKGLACATVAELLYLVDAGFEDILLTSAVADPVKAAMIAEVNRRTKLAVVVDHPQQAALLDAAVGKIGGTLQVLVDIDVGQNRAGTADITSCIETARAIERSAHLVFAGLQGFAGQAQHIVEEPARREAAGKVAAYLKECADALQRAGFAIDWITGSGTGTSRYDASGLFTELQVGSYLFMDADYGRLHGGADAGMDFERSLFVLASVVSVNRAGQVSIDAGVKAFAVNGPPPSLMIGVREPMAYRFAGDEHGILTPVSGATLPRLGDRILLEATHCDPTVNLYGGFHAVHADGHVERWETGGRYA